MINIKIVHATALIALGIGTSVGLTPIAAYAQLEDTQIRICNKRTVQSSFNLDGKAETLKAQDCRTYSARSALFYTEFGRNPRYSLERRLLGGNQYDFQMMPSGKLDLVVFKIIPL